MNKEESSPTLRWLFLDMNSFFASCEQQLNPALRGRPVAVVPMEADTTCAIAASYEAKKFGVRTGTLVKDARAMCPGIVFVPARPRRYVEFHHAFLDAIETCMPVEDVCSIDEVACRLDRVQQRPEEAVVLAKRIKQAMREKVGPALTCSIGLASNRLLGKLASDMQKPDGLVMLHPDDMPKPILHLKPSDICGIGPNMDLRLQAAGIITMRDLWAADEGFLRRVWGGVMGSRFHALLHGADLPAPTHPRRSMSHQHVLAPETRSREGAEPIVRQLLIRVAQRLRREDFYAKRLLLHVKWQGGLGGWAEEARFAETRDTVFLLQTLGGLWRQVPRLKPLRVGVVLADLVPASAHQYDLFEKRRNTALTEAVDRVNERFGRGTLGYGVEEGPKTSKIAFTRVPTLEET